MGVALMNLGRATARRGDDVHAAELLAHAAETLEVIGSEQTVDVAIREGERLLLAVYATRIKGTDPQQEPLVMFWLDQSGHTVALALTALAVCA